jgi:CDP-diacylglycerol--glycerol-3-phosphate 3-phosphatidyltransferase
MAMICRAELMDCQRKLDIRSVGRKIRTPMWRHVPNLITGARLVLALVFFVMLAYYQYEGRGDPTYIWIAFIIYAVALFTDFLDGYLARKWKVEGQFGRIVDPFVDKILVLGSFIFFAGKNFIIQDQIVTEGRMLAVVKTITGIAPGIVVILLARELLVTSLRGSSESGGKSFGAAFAGKVKMVVQSVTILVILVYVNYYNDLKKIEPLDSFGNPKYSTLFRNFCIWVTVLVTVASGLLYIQKAIAMYRESERAGAA